MKNLNQNVMNNGKLQHQWIDSIFGEQGKHQDESPNGNGMKPMADLLEKLLVVVLIGTDIKSLFSNHWSFLLLKSMALLLPVGRLVLSSLTVKRRIRG